MGTLLLVDLLKLKLFHCTRLCRLDRAVRRSLVSIELKAIDCFQCRSYWESSPSIPVCEVCEGYAFTGVCLSTGRGVCLNPCWDTHLPQADTPRADTPHWADTPRADTPLRSACWDTVNKRAVRILRECNLVNIPVKLNFIVDWNC